MKIVSVVPTPNPNALKFTFSEQILATGSKSFLSESAAEKDPFASELFKLEGVTSVFYMSDFISVNKQVDISWDVLEPQIITKLKDIEQTKDEEPTQQEEETLVERRRFNEMSPVQRIIKIDKILDDEIRPSLAGDGGGIEIVGLEEFDLQVHYEGACGSCPSSTSGTLAYIQGVLQNHVDERLTVSPV